MWVVDNATPYTADRSWVQDKDSNKIWLVAVKATFDLLADGSTLLADEQQPVLRMSEPRGEEGKSSLRYESDLLGVKPSTDVLVNGSAWAPHGRRCSSTDVLLRVGPITKFATGIWRARWERGIVGRPTISEPEPFESMPIVFERAYGGWDRWALLTRRDTAWRHATRLARALPRAPRMPLGRPSQTWKMPAPDLGVGDRPAPAGLSCGSCDWSPRRESPAPMTGSGRPGGRRFGRWIWMRATTSAHQAINRCRSACTAARPSNSGGRALRLEPNTNGAPNVIAGSPLNVIASGVYGATIAGGQFNTILTNAGYAVVGGGTNNVIQSGFASTISGGDRNIANGDYGTVAGGFGNSSSGLESAIAGGQFNSASSDSTFVGGGFQNSASGLSSTISGGTQNNASGYYGSIGGGYQNQTAGNFLGGATVAGGWLNHASIDMATIAGGYNNIASAYGSTIGGGGYDGSTTAGNRANGNASAVGGGLGNQATNNYATIGGGNANIAGGLNSTVAGGLQNVASGSSSTVSGGHNNTASGRDAIVAGGNGTTASGDYSFAAGSGAQAAHQGAFVWADSVGSTYSSERANQVKVRAAGGMILDVSSSSGLNPAAFRVNSTSANGVGIFVAQTSSDATAVFTAAGTGDIIKGFNADNFGNPVFEVINSGATYATSFNSTSDRNAKENFAAVSAADILDKVALLPITEWNFKTASADEKHVGPMAQDFHAAFGLNGGDDKHISVVDEGGVALAAIQGLNQKLEMRSDKAGERIQKLEAENAQLKARLDKLEQLMLKRESN